MTMPAPSDPRFGPRWRRAQVVILVLAVLTVVGSIVLIAQGAATDWWPLIPAVLLTIAAGGNLLVTRRGRGS